MPRQDFVMQLLAQLRGVLPYILDLVRAGNYHEAHALIDQSVRELVGVGLDGVMRLEETAVIELLQRRHSTAWEEGYLFLVAMLTEESEILLAEGETDRGVARAFKALNLLLYLGVQDGELPQHELIPSVDSLLTRVADYHLPPQSSAYLLQYLEAQGEFAAAENVLFDWVEADTAVSTDHVPNPIETGVAFYERLLAKSDQQIVAGGLTRAEVQDSLAELTLE